jgi:hypothetical protein
MRLINRSAKDIVGGPACAAALKSHYEKFGDHGRSYFYTVMVGKHKVTVEVVNRRRSYVATAMTGARQIKRMAELGDF